MNAAIDDLAMDGCIHAAKAIGGIGRAPFGRAE
jgi:hypothetical protein